MRAMVSHAAGRPLELEERPDPEPGPDEIRIPGAMWTLSGYERVTSGALQQEYRVGQR